MTQLTGILSCLPPLLLVLAGTTAAQGDGGEYRKQRKGRRGLWKGRKGGRRRRKQYCLMESEFRRIWRKRQRWKGMEGKKRVMERRKYVRWG